MTILTIILFVALVIVAWLRQQFPSVALNALLIVLAVACLTAAVLVWRRPQIEAAHWVSKANRMKEAIAFELGHAVAQAFPQGGDVLVLLPGLPAKFPEDGLGAAQVKALQAGFGRDNLHAVSVSYTAVSEAEAMEVQSDWPRLGVPLVKINEWFTGHPGAVAVVSFVNVVADPQPSQIPPLFLSGLPAIEPHPGVTEDLLNLVKPGALEAVAVHRPGFNWEQAVAQSSLPEVFQQCCEMITPANVAEAGARLTGVKP